MTGVRKRTAAAFDMGLAELGPKALIGGGDEIPGRNNQLAVKKYTEPPIPLGRGTFSPQTNQPPGSPPRGADGAVSSARWSRKLNGIEAI